MVKQDVAVRIADINNILEWYKKYKPDSYNAKFRALVPIRCQLRRVLAAWECNPAIAAYGESQKGKSYLMSNLLQDDGRPFAIAQPGTDERVDFTHEINPMGDDREATGVVTRFTSFNGEYAGKYSEEHPVLIKLFTVGEIAAILCDSYFNDIMDYDGYKETVIEEIGDAIYNTYKDKDDIYGTPLTEDDIFDIRDYILKFVNNAKNSFGGASSAIFDKLALVIRKIPQSEWANVLSFLWHKNQDITNLFDRLVRALARLDFAKEVYLNLDAVLHHGDNTNTIMSVKCLKHMDSGNPQLLTDVFIRNDSGFRKVSSFHKGELCAICAEAVYKVEKEYMRSTVSYTKVANVEDMAVEGVNLPKEEKTIHNILQDGDLLDFPGARNRLSLQKNMLMAFDANEGAPNLVQSLLRGKVAYLFNKYCSSLVINVLMFCHDNKNAEVTKMYSVIKDWVESYVGENASARAESVSKYGKIAPLFVIATKFNLDMRMQNFAAANTTTAINQRWDGRFTDVLLGECLKGNSVDWFKDWIAKGESFNNTYLLRDFKYSGCDADGSHLYEGFDPNTTNPEETRMHIPVEFYNTLRESFISSGVVRRLFADPAKAWDCAATINNDGSAYIIENLSIAAQNMGRVREAKFESEVDDAKLAIKRLIEGDYEPEDDTKILRKNIRTARRLMADLECASGDNYFFGHLISGLQIDQGVVYNIVNNIISNPAPIAANFEGYELILTQCRYFEGCATEEDKWNLLIDRYGFDSRDEAEKYFQKKNIDIAVLLQGTRVNATPQYVISEAVCNKWVESLQKPELVRSVLGESGFDESVLLELIKKLISLSKGLKLVDIMADAVEPYLRGLVLTTDMSDLIADILTHVINDFVSDMGYAHRTEQQKEQCLSIAQTHVRDRKFEYITKDVQEIPDEDELVQIFNSMADHDKITPTFEHNLNKWIDCMFFAFIGTEARIIQNPVANAEMGAILERLS